MLPSGSPHPPTRLVPPRNRGVRPMSAPLVCWVSDRPAADNDDGVPTFGAIVATATTSAPSRLFAPLPSGSARICVGFLHNLVGSEPTAGFEARQTARLPVAKCFFLRSVIRVSMAADDTQQGVCPHG